MIAYLISTSRGFFSFFFFFSFLFIYLFILSGWAIHIVYAAGAETSLFTVADWRRAGLTGGSTLVDLDIQMGNQELTSYIFILTRTRK